MDANRRGNLVIGLLLLLIGGWFLAVQFYPQLGDLVQIDYQWPLIVVGVGLVFLIMAVLVRAPGLAVPASIIGGIGAILYYQNNSGDWESWAYAWTLIPGFVGFGVLLTNLLEGKLWKGLKEGVGLMLFSLFMFGIFSGFLGGPEIFSRLWPLFLIGAGVWMLVKGMRGSGQSSSASVTTATQGQEETP
ncbi:MAG: hypothetical protein WEC37_03410 [Anaerolineales bacterium]